MIQHDVLIEQHGESETPELRDPLLRARVILVIARDEKRAVPRAQVRERTRVIDQMRHRAVDDVARHGDQIRPQAVDGCDDVLDVMPLDRRADMDVADLHDGEALQRGGQPGDGDIDADYGRAPPCIIEADGGQQHGQRAIGDQFWRTDRRAVQPVGEMHDEQHHIAREGEQQRRKKLLR